MTTFTIVVLTFRRGVGSYLVEDIVVYGVGEVLEAETVYVVGTEVSSGGITLGPDRW